MKQWDDSQLIKWFAGASYPASKGELYKTAKHNRASQEMLDTVNTFDPNHTFRGYSDAMVALGIQDYSPAATETKARRGGREQAA